MRTLIPSLLLAAFSLGAGADLYAGTVRYWTPSVEDKKRKEVSVEGDIQSWNWKSGVSVKPFEEGKPSVTVARKNLISATRTVSSALQNALNNNNEQALKNLWNTAKSELDKEDAAFAYLGIQFANKDSVKAIAEHKKYTKSFNDGNYIAQVLQQLADLQFGAGKSNDAISTLADLAKLGDWQKASANVQIGHKLLNSKKTNKAATYFEQAIAPATKVQDASLEMESLGWAGHTARLLDDNKKAKKHFDAFFKVNTEHGFNAGAAHARGIAYFGLGEIGGNTKDAYNNFRLASFWLEGKPNEGKCFLKMMNIAEALAGTETDGAKWTKRAKKIKEIVQQRWPKLLE